MELWLTVLLWSLVGSVLSLIAGVLLLTQKMSVKVIQLIAVPFAAGSLLAASFLDLLPEAFSHHDDTLLVAIAVLAGFLIFFVLERFLTWFHHHESHLHHSAEVMPPAAHLVILGDTLHNFIDGLVIGAAFLIDVPTGIVATLAIAAHEIPQEVGDFGLLLGLGVRRRFVLGMNLLSALATVVAALGVVALGSSVLSGAEPYLLALAAGFFIYIAAADIIPTIHAERELKRANIQTAVLIAGIIAVGWLITFAHSYIDHGHDHGHSGHDHHLHDSSHLEHSIQ